MNISQDIAVIAMNCRFPGASSTNAYWQILVEGRSPIYVPSNPSERVGSSISIDTNIQNATAFDYAFFGYTKSEAELIDPQHRLFLQLAWEVLEFAGYNPFTYPGLIGVFAGTSISTYLINYLIGNPLVDAVGELQTLIHNDKDYLTSTLAYHLNLKGPCVTVQSSCSTSLSAIHMACESLLSGQCDIALAGGVTLTFPESSSYLYREGGLVSRDGRICAFDASASGTVYSNGAGIVALKRLGQAIEDGDHITAVIKGTALNNDGADRMAFSSPGVEGQSLVITEALSISGIPAESIAFIETHGSGTPLGDSIEFEAMKQAFVPFTDRLNFCAIGSVKTNIGHTQTASGIAGFIKACLAIYHKKLPPSLNFSSPNPQCDFASSPFYVNTALQDLSYLTSPIRAGVNSFGLGGTNVHVVLEEYIEERPASTVEGLNTCVISAKNSSALKRLCHNYIDWLEKNLEANLNDFAYTTRVGRVSFPHQCIVTFLNHTSLIQQLKECQEAPLSSSIDLHPIQGYYLKRIALPSYSFETTPLLAQPANHSLEQDDKVTTPLAALKSIWENILGVTIKTLEDNFFEEGGHSLLATQLLFSVEQQFSCRVTLQDFLQAPTLQGLYANICRRSQNNHRSTPFPTITQNFENIGEPFPLTDIQQAYWMGRQPELGFGNISTHMYFEKEVFGIDLKRFEEALNQTIRRHSMLRAIVLENGTQRILETTPPYVIHHHDLRNETPDKQADILRALRDHLSHEILETTQWPLFRITASILDDSTVRIHTSIDLLILDAWSIELWFRELEWYYKNPGHELSPLTISFRDYVLAASQLESSPLYLESKTYWLKRVEDGIYPAPQLPLAKQPDQIDKPLFSRFQGDLTKIEYSQLIERGKQSGITVTAILLGAFSEVLRLFSENPSFTLNLTLFNRLPLHEDVDALLGDFTSLTLLAVEDAPQATFLERLHIIQQQLWKDIEYKYFSGPRVTRELMKTVESTPLFPIVFTSLLNQKTLENNSERVFLSTPDDQSFSISQTPQVWIDHQVMDQEGCLKYNWDVLTDLFPEGFIPTLFEIYRHFLKKLATSSIPWSHRYPLQGSTQSLYPSSLEFPKKMLHTDLLNQFLTVPQAPAIITEECIISFGQLDHYSSVIETFLIKKKLIPGELVAIVMPKGWHSIATMIGILRAGGAFLPIDTSYPQQYIEEMLTTSGVRIALSIDEIPINNVTQVHFDGELSKTLFTTMDSSPDRLAYAFFTSGSTGTPKCVEITHVGAVNTLSAVREKYLLSKESIALSLSSFSFDLSIFDIFAILSVGGHLVIPHVTQSKDPSKWGELIMKHGVNIWNSTPAVMQMFYDYFHDQESPSPFFYLKFVLLSGDIINPDLVKNVKNRYSIPHLVALGGATEGSIWSVWYEVTGNEKKEARVPLGQPMPNQYFLVLDANLEQCPPFRKGELFIGGIGVAIGYRNYPEETAKRFINHPQWGKLYKTGDRGCYRMDGLIDFLGRLDNQVKIRGHRIELEEIEVKLCYHPSVQSALVRAVDGRLVSYVQLKKQENLEIPNNEGLIVDPIERLQFKMKDPAIRALSSSMLISLEDPVHDESAFLRRRSYRHFVSDPPLPVNRLSGLLSHLRAIDIPGFPFKKREYGSGGGLYPIQVYLAIQYNRVEGIENGVYYYHPYQHQLIPLSKESISSRLFSYNNVQMADLGSFMIFLVAEYAAIYPMYGQKMGQTLALIEAGAIAQLLETVSTNYLIGLCQTGGIDYAKMRELFNLSSTSEFVHCIVGGPITQEAISIEGLVRDLDSNASSTMNHLPQEDPMTILKHYLASKLPEYKIPSEWHLVDKIPLTPNGKINRKAHFDIKKPIVEISLSSHNHIDLELEMVLIGLWEKVLKGTKISPVDNFFDRGGSSINLATVYKEIQNVVDVKISMTDLFKYPTIRSLVHFLNGEVDSTKKDSILSSKEKERSEARRSFLKKQQAEFCSSIPIPHRE